VRHLSSGCTTPLFQPHRAVIETTAAYEVTWHRYVESSSQAMVAVVWWCATPAASCLGTSANSRGKGFWGRPFLNDQPQRLLVARRTWTHSSSGMVGSLHLSVPKADTGACVPPSDILRVNKVDMGTPCTCRSQAIGAAHHREPGTFLLIAAMFYEAPPHLSNRVCHISNQNNGGSWRGVTRRPIVTL
jgi:hypothetical protein